MAPKLGYEPVDTNDVPVPRELEVSVPGGISGTIAIPHGVDSDDVRWATPTNRMVLILHGQMGHRDYCYQKLLAHRLAAYRGMYSLRIDFRGCGSLDDYADPKIGRVVESDLEDITRSMEFITNKALNPLGIDFVPLAIIAHSRGAVVMYLWALQQEDILRRGDPNRKAFRVPNLVSCSARYNSLTIFEKHDIIDDDFEGVDMNCLRYGKTQLVSVPRQELVSLIDVDLTCVKDIPECWSVMSVYGQEDDVVAPNDGAQFSNLLNRCRHSHHLEIIKHADHNFLGLHHIENDDDMEDHNPEGLPIDKKSKLVNYRYHVASAISHWLKPENELLRFLHANLRIGDLPRWKSIDGVFDFRDIGGWRLLRPTFSDKLVFGLSVHLRSGFIYRSACIKSISAQGAEAVKNLGIKTIYDLRSSQETDGDVDPGYLVHARIKRISSPVIDVERVSPQAIARNSSLLSSASSHVYEEILQENVQPLRVIFMHIKDKPQEPFLITCSNGRDITGVTVMLIMKLAGVDAHTIAQEHGLSVHGYQAGQSQITKTNVVERVATNGTIKGRKGQAEPLSIAMFKALETLEVSYGGILSYMRNHLGFVESEIREIYGSLVTTARNPSVNFPVCKI